MKKLFLLMSMASAIISFAGCQKNEIEGGNDVNGVGSTFDLVADIEQTKTTLDGLSVNWEEGDVIYMVTSDGTWGKAYADDNSGNTIADFIYGDGKFSTEATISDGTYTFKAMYASASQRSYHRGTSSTHKLEPNQSQNCTNPTAHIKLNDALVGTFEATTPMTEAAKVTMSHLYTMMQVDVKNTTGAEIEITKFEMTAEGADLAGVFNVEAFDTPTITTKQGASETITVNITGGSVANNAALSVYFVMAPLADYSGNVTFKVTDANSNTYTKTVAMNGISFEAGKYNTTPYTISAADEVGQAVTWDMTKASYESSSTSQVKWTSDYVDFVLNKAESSTAANNYLGGTNAHTRVYKGQTLTFTPVANYIITKIEFSATSGDYAGHINNATWSNAKASMSGTLVTITPTDGHNPVSATIGTATRFTSIKVYYSLDENYVAPTLESITISDYKTEIKQNSTFVFGGTVMASYSDGSKADVTSSATYAGYNMSEAGEQTVTVSYKFGDVTATTTYTLTVIALQDKPTELIEINIADFLNEAVSTTVWYQLTGEVTNIANETYGNFTIQDATGEVYVYGMTSDWVGNNDKSFSTIGLKVGDVVTIGTLRTEHNGTAQGGGNDYPAYYISHKERCAKPVISCADNTVTITAETGATIYYTTNGADPSTSSDKYESAFEITETVTVKAIAVAEGKVQSVVAEKSCTWVDPNAGTPDTQEYTYSWTATSGALGTVANGSTTMSLSDVDWTISRSDNAGYTGWGNNVIQIGSKNNPENLTLKTSGISGTIKSVLVECASYSAKHNISISVGGVPYASEATPNWTNSTVGTVSCEGNATGDIEIKFEKGTGSRALYIKSIKIVYEN